MSDPVLNEEIARLEIEIDGVRDALDEAIKRNEALEAALATAREALEMIENNEPPGSHAWVLSRDALASSEPKP